jgi:hypothetical protein
MNAVGIEDRISANDRAAKMQALGRHYPVERVSVLQRQTSYAIYVLGLYRKKARGGIVEALLEEAFRGSRKRQFAGSDFDTDLPNSRQTDVADPIRVFDMLASLDGKAGVRAEKPEETVGVEEDCAQERYSLNSSGVSSKSSLIQIFPRIEPYPLTAAFCLTMTCTTCPFSMSGTRMSSFPSSSTVIVSDHSLNMTSLYSSRNRRQRRVKGFVHACKHPILGRVLF